MYVKALELMCEDVIFDKTETVTEMTITEIGLGT